MLVRVITIALSLSLAGLALAQSLTVYSGRGEALVQPLVERFTAETGIEVNIRFGGTAELAVLILEEGRASPADLFWGQDAGALGALSLAGRLTPLDDALTAALPGIYTSRSDLWVATSGRARVLAYSPERTADVAWPASVFDLTDPVYRGRVAWAPTNGSFQAFVTAMRVVHGESATEAWLRGMIANDVQAYRNNTTMVEAIAAGEVDYAITNNYYLLRFLANDPSYPVAQSFFEDGDIGNLVNVAGAGIVNTSGNVEAARQFLAFLLSAEAQSYFTIEVHEYPVVPGIEPNTALVGFDALLAASPDVDLDVLEDLEGTLELLREVGLL
ncbi:MAG: iron ABC transporter substrate-binding protein [Trueperaceae bacterium]|nr:MAG: iron ABC transporter substrate-binding protein [Trueperaceae bacterium]